MNSKHQKRIVGDVVAIPLKDGAYGFGCVLEEPLVAFFDFRSNTSDVPVESLLENPIAFKIWVINSAIVDGHWPVIGNLKSTHAINQKVRFFKQDPISKSFSITYNGGDETPSTLEECKELERAAVWETTHVVDRLKDHFAGHPNKWVESLRAQ